MDRFINIGHRGKPFASPDPSLDTHLPSDDASWDKGQMLVAAPLSLSASQTISVAPFARTCQSVHLLGKVLRHIDDKQLPLDYRFEEAMQLSRTLRALADVLPSQASEDDASMQPSLCTSMAICYSGLLTLYDTYSCSERAMESAGEPQLLMQKESIEGLSEYSGRVVELARKVRSVIERDGTGRLSPMIIDAFYNAAANCKPNCHGGTAHDLAQATDTCADAWYVRESSDPACGERLIELKELLVLLDRRWKVAGQYLFIIGDFWNREDLKPPSSEGIQMRG